MNDTEYRNWLTALKARYHAAQVKAAVSVNGALIEFYWALGRDIEERFGENHYGAAFFECLSNDLCVEIPNVKGLSPINLRYANRFYRLYRILPQLVGELMKVPWSSHRLIIDRSGGDADKAAFYVRRTIENNWSRRAFGRNTKTGTRAGGQARPNGVRSFPLTSRLDFSWTSQDSSGDAARAERPNAIRPAGLGACPRHETLRDTKKHERENFSIRRFGDSEIDSGDCAIVGRNDSATHVKTPKEFSVLGKSENGLAATGENVDSNVYINFGIDNTGRQTTFYKNWSSQASCVSADRISLLGKSENGLAAMGAGNFSIRRFVDSSIDSGDCVIVERYESATQVKTPEEFSVLGKSENGMGAMGAKVDSNVYINFGIYEDGGQTTYYNMWSEMARMDRTTYYNNWSEMARMVRTTYSNMWSGLEGLSTVHEMWTEMARKDRAEAFSVLIKSENGMGRENCWIVGLLDCLSDGTKTALSRNDEKTVASASHGDRHSATQVNAGDLTPEEFSVLGKSENGVVATWAKWDAASAMISDKKAA